MRARSLELYESERLDPVSVDVRTRSEWNRRDAIMAQNLHWLIEHVYAGRKVIVWAHNAHLMNAYFAANWNAVQLQPQTNGLKPAGAFIAEWLKQGVYTIAMTTYDGEDGWANGQMHATIAPAPEGSLESHLHRLGKPFVFLDLRAVRSDSRSPMRTPQSMRVSGYGPPTVEHGNERIPDLTRAFDAVFYVDHTAPATPICIGRCATGASATP